MFENYCKYVPFKSDLCIGTEEDQLKPGNEKRYNHEYASAALVFPVFPAQAEFSYFSVDLTLRIFL